MLVVGAGGAAAGLAGHVHRREQEAGQHPDNRDDDQEFDQREGRSAGAAGNRARDGPLPAVGCSVREAYRPIHLLTP